MKNAVKKSLAVPEWGSLGRPMTDREETQQNVRTGWLSTDTRIYKKDLLLLKED